MKSYIKNCIVFKLHSLCVMYFIFYCIIKLICYEGAMKNASTPTHLQVSVEFLIYCNAKFLQVD